jgi:hypothetical protein
MGVVVNNQSREPSTMTKIITPNTNSKIATVGLDLAKNSFSVHAFDEAGNTVLTKDLKRRITVTPHLIDSPHPLC